MDSIERAYFNLTGVDLEVQRRIWDERGKGYYGEYQVFKKLYTCVPGNCKILMNLHIPVANQRTTEIDLLMIHETGIYVFEVKHYKGTIYGDSEGDVWTQYFRTAKNNVFENPIHQNGYHIRALANLIPNIPIYSAVVFTNDECDLRVENHNPYLVVASLGRLEQQLQPWLNKDKIILSAEQIDSLFQKLTPYSPLSKQKVSSEPGVEAPIYEYMALLKADMDTHTNAAVERANLAEKKAAKAKSYYRRRLAIACLLIAGIATFLCFGFMTKCNEEVEHAQQELQEMQQKFEHVEAYDNDYLKLIRGMITVENIKLEASPDIENAAILSCKVVNHAEEYGIMFNRDSTYIVMFRDGTIQEYDMFGERLSYSSSSSKLAGTKHSTWCASSGELVPLEMYNIPDINDITYIKITNVSLWKWGVNSNKSLMDNLALTVYQNE